MPHAYRHERIVGRMRQVDIGDVEEARILCMGDLHVGDAHADLDMIRLAVAWLLKAPDRYALIAGDLFNAALKDSVSDVYSEAMTVKESRKTLVRLLEPAHERILAAVGGNHDHRIRQRIGDDFAEIVCAEAGIPYFDGQAVLKVSVGHYKNTPGRVRDHVSYIVYMTHGWGGGRMAGGKLNNLLRLGQIVQGCDLYVAGHTHDPIIKPEEAWVPSRNGTSITAQRQMYICTGAALDRGNGYAVRFGYPALAKVWPVVLLDGTHKDINATTRWDKEPA